VEKFLFGAFALLLVASLWLLLRARQGSPDRHSMTIQALLAAGMMCGNLPSAFELHGTSLAVGARVVAGALLVATFVQLRRTKRVRQSWLAQQREGELRGPSA
jgi:hypothetical protein